MAQWIREKQIVSRTDDDGKRIEGKLPISHATLWRWVAKGLFPRPYRLSEGVTAWDSEEVEAWRTAKLGQAE